MEEIETLDPKPPMEKIETLEPKPSSHLQPEQELPDPKRQKLSTDEQTEENTPTLPKKPRYKQRKIAIFFAYCGVGYQGMQKNPGAKTIEGDLEEALFFSGAIPEEDRGRPQRFEWARSARTDKGVSAVGQVVSGRFYVDPPSFVERLNSKLTPQIRIFGYKRVTPSFNAKKFCDRRRYVYLIPVFALDPSSHRDGESVLGRLGSGDEIVDCLDCSERGRKAFESKNAAETVKTGSGISSNNVGALLEETITKSNGIANNDSETILSVETEIIEKVDEEKAISADSDISSSNKTALVEEKVVVYSLENKNGDSDINKASIETEIVLENGVEENEKIQEDKVENDNGNVEFEKIRDFRYGEEEKKRFNRILKYYEGTHNFHNFTTRTKAEDPSAKRYIVSFNANTVVNIDGIEFVKCEVIGQSFMLHQIRKMIGLAVAIMRNYAPESVIETAFQQKVNINIPMAPEVGLYLDECFFPSYNNKWKHSHEELSMKAYAKEAEEFKMKYIYSHIAATEHKEGVMGLFLHSLDYRNYADLRAYNVPKSDSNGDEVVENRPSSETKLDDTDNTAE
ncbi:hypothetical protein ACJIZ3_002771 [Penstemon smallii]|uniref:Pseudouridine synthase I TruA alpha/beta domain-containing protein n=1 Tax=Penstemon smallii TaxID=265156 RepID=A0ABD3UA60_9LAMI